MVRRGPFGSRSVRNPANPLGEYRFENVRNHCVADEEGYPWFRTGRGVALVLFVECCGGRLRYGKARVVFLYTT